jgi:hypothetical protein
MKLTNSEYSIYGKSSVNILKTTDSLSYISIQRLCRNGNRKEGIAYTRNLPSVVEISDTNITLTKYFTIPSKKLFRFEEEKVTVFLPVGAKIFMNNGIDEVIENADLPYKYSYDSLAGNTWVMTENGLEPYKQ